MSEESALDIPMGARTPVNSDNGSVAELATNLGSLKLEAHA